MVLIELSNVFIVYMVLILLMHIIFSSVFEVRLRVIGCFFIILSKNCIFLDPKYAWWLWLINKKRNYVVYTFLIQFKTVSNLI